MSKRTNRRREIERLFATRDREGLSLRQLADRSGIPVGTLSWWSHRLRSESGPAFCEVRVAHEETPATPPRRTHGGSVDLRLRLPGGVVAEFGGDLAERVSGVLLESLARWS